jgi:hypothetical protein
VFSAVVFFEDFRSGGTGAEGVNSENHGVGTVMAAVLLDFCHTINGMVGLAQRIGFIFQAQELEAALGGSVYHGLVYIKPHYYPRIAE